MDIFFGLCHLCPNLPRIVFEGVTQCFGLDLPGELHLRRAPSFSDQRTTHPFRCRAQILHESFGVLFLFAVVPLLIFADAGPLSTLFRLSDVSVVSALVSVHEPGTVETVGGLPPCGQPLECWPVSFFDDKFGNTMGTQRCGYITQFLVTRFQVPFTGWNGVQQGSCSKSAAHPFTS